MLDHLSIAAMSPTALAAVGAAILLIGEIAALVSLPNLAWTFALSTVAELGYVLIGFGVGGAAGDTGALMHLGYQAAMRGLVLAAGWHLVRRTGSANLNVLAGSGPRMPVAATLFGFGVFSVMGLSPFKGSFSKFIILYAAIEQGQWLVAFAGTLATIVAAVYYILIVQKICLEPAARPIELAPAPRAALAIAWPLTALTVLISLWPAPFLLFAARLAGFAGAEGVPQFETPWATARPRPLCRRLRRLPHRPRFGAGTRHRRRLAGDRHRRRGRAGWRARPGLAAVRAAVLRHLLPDDRLFDRLHRPRRHRPIATTSSRS